MTRDYVNSMGQKMEKGLLMRKFMSVLFFSGLLLILPPAFGADRLVDLAWLQGHWVSSGEEGKAEEIWFSPEGGVMTGMFRSVGADGFQVAELLLITAEEDGIILRFKHFRADYSNWEGDGPPITLILSHVSTDEILFTDPEAQEGDVASLHYERQGDDGLSATIALAGQGEFSIPFTRYQP